MKTISIAIDGPSGAGKSTMARKVAAELNYLYVDTGAIYRSVSLYAYRAGVDKTDSEKIVSLLPEIHIDMQYQADGIQHMILNGEDVTDAIRFLREREIVHFQRFGECLRLCKEKMNSKNVYLTNPAFDRK